MRPERAQSRIGDRDSLIAFAIYLALSTIFIGRALIFNSAAATSVKALIRQSLFGQ